MKFHIHNHQGKSNKLIAALLAHGWEQMQTPGKADVLFTDVDIAHHSKDLELLHRRGKKIVIVPHAGQPNIFGDFPEHEPFAYTSVQFVPAQGHIDVMRAWGYKLPLEVMGWHLCEVLPFCPHSEVRNVLFAPVHPNADGSLSHIEIDLNKTAYEKLLILHEQGSIKLTVRHLQKLEKNGLWKVPGVKYVQGEANQSTYEIDNADVVVARQTMQYLAVARGVPTVGIGEDIAPPMGSNGRGNFHQVRSWAKYKDLMAFPVDILKHQDTLGLFGYTALTDEMIKHWRRRMVGQPFDPELFIQGLEKHL